MEIKKVKKSCTGLIFRAPLSIVVLATLFLCPIGVASYDGDDPDLRKVDSGQRPTISAGPPIYPSYCLQRGLQGYVDFEFTIDADGYVLAPTVIAVIVFKHSVSEPIDDDKAKQNFVSAGEIALSRWRYEPQIEKGLAVETLGNKTRISFELATAP